MKLSIECSGKFDKMVADSHFSLAGVYAEAPGQVVENMGWVDQFVSDMGGNGNGMDGFGDSGNDSNKQELSEEEKAEFRQRSL